MSIDIERMRADSRAELARLNAEALRNGARIVLFTVAVVSVMMLVTAASMALLMCTGVLE
jgi:hypothetical protein